MLFLLSLTKYLHKHFRFQSPLQLMQILCMITLKLNFFLCVLFLTVLIEDIEQLKEYIKTSNASQK